MLLEELVFPVRVRAVKEAVPVDDVVEVALRHVVFVAIFIIF